jgi:hypothetical protein
MYFPSDERNFLKARGTLSDAPLVRGEACQVLVRVSRNPVRCSPGSRRELVRCSSGSWRELAVARLVPGGSLSGARPVLNVSLTGARLVPGGSLSGARPVLSVSLTGARLGPGGSLSGARLVPGGSLSGARPVLGGSLSGARLVPGESLSGARPGLGGSLAGARLVPGGSLSGACLVRANAWRVMQWYISSFLPCSVKTTSGGGAPTAQLGPAGSEDAPSSS